MFCGTCHAKAKADQVFCDKCGADQPKDGWGPDTLPGTIIGTKYRLEERLGDGGMGYVYRARHVDLGTDFALKFLHRDLTTSVHRKRFMREAQVAATLRNPHTVGVIDFAGEGDQLYLVMEYVAGADLASFVEENGAPSPWFVVEMLRQLATALEEAHDQGTVHRDLKPENILIAPSKRGLLFKLTDFGIASLMHSDNERLTRTGMVHGSPGYMSPEQGRGERKLDGRADLYALGVIAWELLADRPMFEASTPLELIMCHIGSVPTSLREIRPPPDVPAELHDILDGLLCKERDDRIADAGELLDMLHRLQAQAPELDAARPADGTPESKPVAAAEEHATPLPPTQVVKRPRPTTTTKTTAISPVHVASKVSFPDLPDAPQDGPADKFAPAEASGWAQGTKPLTQLSKQPHPYDPVGNPARKSSPGKKPTATVDKSDARQLEKQLSLPPNDDNKSGATGRIETLAGTPYGYDPVGNPRATAEKKKPRNRQQPPNPAKSPKIRVSRDDEDAPKNTEKPIALPENEAPELKTRRVEPLRSETAVTAVPKSRELGDSLGDVDDIYDRLPSQRGRKIVAGVLFAAALGAAAYWLLMMHA